MEDKGYRISQVSALTGVKPGTIRFYERCGFLEKVERRPNGYRIFNMHHIYQVRICRLVFGGFVNRHLRRISMGVIEAASRWDLEAYNVAAKRYQQAVEEDIHRTRQVIDIAVMHMEQDSSRAVSATQDGSTDKVYSKKQAAAMVGVTPEAIRNWERNGLLPQGQPYQRRFYGQQELNRMYVIRFLLDAGYSIMAILRFLTDYDHGEEQKALQQLFGPKESEDLMHRADRYLETLIRLREKTAALCGLLEEMKKI